ncbi:hypothetical protein L209DRAFT_167990 [Thermothelomyces heterothallicus CBS 203.75]
MRCVMSADPSRDVPYHLQKTDSPHNLAHAPTPLQLPRPNPSPVGSQKALLPCRACHQPDTYQHDSPFLALPNDILLLILEVLDPTALELLRRTCRSFLAVLPAFYPHLFSSQLQGPLPWPVRRPWTLGAEQRRELGRLVARDSVLPGGTGVRRRSCGFCSCPCRCFDCCSGPGSMLGLTKAWRYIPCARCGRVHPPRKVRHCRDSG